MRIRNLSVISYRKTHFLKQLGGGYQEIQHAIRLCSRLPLPYLSKAQIDAALSEISASRPIFLQETKYAEHFGFPLLRLVLDSQYTGPDELYLRF